MSSHHVVREKQEPALLVLSLDSFDEELLGQLLEWSPTVIVSGEIAEKLHSFGIKIDWVIGDAVTGIEQEHVKLVPGGAGSNAGAALKFLVEQGYPAVNVVADDLDLADYTPFAGKIDLVIFYQHKKIYPVHSGFSKWKPAGEVIEVVAPPADLKTEGLAISTPGVFQTTHDGFFSLQFNAPFIFVAELL